MSIDGEKKLLNVTQLGEGPQVWEPSTIYYIISMENQVPGPQSWQSNVHLKQVILWEIHKNCTKEATQVDTGP